eukprot:COSAG01_NODE_31717_length_592_cov_2.219067_1_plen_79_part_00
MIVPLDVDQGQIAAHVLIARWDAVVDLPWAADQAELVHCAAAAGACARHSGLAHRQANSQGPSVRALGFSETPLILRK